ncbi:MAG: cyanophycinase [Acidobacteria bacterium]|nr:cyanophycinase [Acidobacteriota bacterium]
MRPRRWSRLIWLLLLVCLPCGLPAQLSEGPAKGSLVAVGGGRIGPDIVRRFLALAGGTDARFVVIPTAAEDPVDPERARQQFSKQFCVTHITVLHTRDRKVADSDGFVTPLRAASAVWFSGGRQWRLVDAYLHTRTQREIEALLGRGGVVGGSSAGATIQGSYLVRGAPEGNSIMMAKGHEEGFGLLKNSAIDQHVNARGRESDLISVIEAHPGLLGIGLDEATAIVVSGRRLEVIGEGKVRIYDGWEHEGRKFLILAPGDPFDLPDRRAM